MLLDENQDFKLNRRPPFVHWEVNVFLLHPGICVGCFREVILVVIVRGQCCSCLVGRGQGYYSASYNAQDGPL